ncbi:hypothetical protein HYT55_03085 [Candidatus Woesearchaeota archaeon]|nr:hypothetical protein [Candidatus Woesearchaeota archaeon]
MKHKKAAKSKTAKVHRARALEHKEHERAHVEKEPEYMIQVGDPKMLRKDLLESLREVIIFMQGYETFRKIQEEKVALFTILKSQIKEINTLVDSKLKKYLPKGKLRSFSEKQLHHQEQVEELPAEEAQPLEVVPVATRRTETQRAPPSELDELEKQLRDIENQLQNIR